MSEVSMQGEFTLTFNESIESLWDHSNTFMFELFVLVYDVEDVQYTFTWNVTEYTNNSLTIQLFFNDSLLVS